MGYIWSQSVSSTFVTGESSHHTYGSKAPRPTNFMLCGILAIVEICGMIVSFMLSGMLVII